MKLNYRFILITFIIILIMSIASTFVFYSLAGRVLLQQQSKSILNSTNDFSFVFQNEYINMEEEFRSISPQVGIFNKINLDSTSIDFCFTLVNDSLINAREFKVKSESYLNIRSSSFRQFFSDNPNVVLRYAQIPNGKTVYYGNQISSKYLNRISQKIRAEVALVINNSPVELSNPEINQKHLLSIINAVRDLRYRNSFDLYNTVLDNADFTAALFVPKSILTPGTKINFIVFNIYREGVEFRDTLRLVMLLVVLAGSALTFIVVWFFTAKLREQVSLLSQAAEITGKGNLDHRVPILTNDEVGKFGETFNHMLDELVRNKRTEKEYSEFLTLINQNPTLIEISDAALSKIIKSTGLTFGVLYLVEHKSLRLISSFGISKNFIELKQDVSLYSNAVEKKEKVEFRFSDNFPEIKTGIASIKIKYLIIYPIIYNKETIGVLELAAESDPHADVRNYIDNIHEQLAVGIINAKSFEQLENFISELKKLNEEYLKQNEQIITQNDELKELHQQLKDKADELERQRIKAVELTKVKSEFLASMSHELRTPLISILGLTELLIKDSSVVIKAKDRLNIVHRNGKKLLSLITNILEFSKFESGKIEVKKESFLLNDILEEIYPNILQNTSEKNLEFNFDVERNSNVLLNTDKSKLEQILINLLVNAVKFTEKGSVRLGIKVINGTDIEFSVADTGIGISDENKKIIFSEFKQVDSSTSRKYGGAGLGLAICKKYVELLGGTLSLQSVTGEGSRFYFVLPDTVLDVVEVQEHQFLTLTEPEKDRQLTKSILIINDNTDTQKLIGDYLASYDFGIMIASNVNEGLRLAKEKLPYAVIFNPFLNEDNLFINESNLWTFIPAMKSYVSTRHIPIVLTIIVEEEKVGWEPEIFDFIIEKINYKNFKELISKVESHFEKNIRKIVFIDTDQNEFETLKKSFEDAFDIAIISSLANVSERIQIEKPHLVIIDVAAFMEQSLQIIYEISQDRLLKNVPVVLKLPKELSNDQINKLNNKFKEIALTVRSHPLDVLKVLRDRLKIDDNVTNRKNNLIEETYPNEQANYYQKNESSKDSKPTVLIVDDNNDALFTIGEFVKEMNCNTIFAHNGMECLLTLNHVEPDLIFLDIMMPQMDGFETIKRIRKEKRFENIPVIALTAYAMLDNKEVIEKSGFNDLVTKPINSQVLASKLKKYLKAKVG
ncbi:MAG: response regulator [Ignavibacteriales bacterium]|nr:response regulator [Ignavibacteriales bacterium]